MELKDYQLAVIQDLATYLDTLLVQCNGELNTAFLNTGLIRVWLIKSIRIILVMYLMFA